MSRCPPISQVVPSIEPLISDVDLFSTLQTLYLVGSGDGGLSFRILTLDRSQSQHERLVSSHHQRVYTEGEKVAYLQHLRRTQPDFRHVSSNYGVIGFVRFTQGYYIHLLTKRSAVPVGMIGMHRIYSVLGTELFSITPSAPHSRAENRRKRSYTSLDLGKGDCFFFIHI